MGLDIYYWTVKKSKSKNPKINRKSEIKKIEANQYTKFFSFRKVNFLMEFFEYEDNCFYLEICKSDLEILVNKCEQVLKERDEEVSKNTLATQPGFFFGSTDYDEYYYDNVKDVLEKFKPLIQTTNDNPNATMDWENESMYMLAWW